MVQQELYQIFRGDAHIHIREWVILKLLKLAFGWLQLPLLLWSLGQKALIDRDKLTLAPNGPAIKITRALCNMCNACYSRSYCFFCSDAIFILVVLLLLSTIQIDNLLMLQYLSVCLLLTMRSNGNTFFSSLFGLINSNLPKFL